MWLPSVWQLPAYCERLEAPWSRRRAMAPWASTDTPLAIRLQDQRQKHEPTAERPSLSLENQSSLPQKSRLENSLNSPSGILQTLIGGHGRTAADETPPGQKAEGGREGGIIRGEP